MFGQLPDTLEDVWVNVALADVERAKLVIDAVPTSHPFEIRYDRIEAVDFESCSRVLDQHAQLDALRVTTAMGIWTQADTNADAGGQENRTLAATRSGHPAPRSPLRTP